MYFTNPLHTMDYLTGGKLYITPYCWPWQSVL